MYDPSMRVLTVLELLQTHGRMSGSELAARMEVSVRTVQRYVARLQDLGIPVASSRGPGGSYRLRPGFRLPPLMFGTEEAFAIALGLDALVFLGLSETAPAAAGVKAKLARVLPETVREQVEALRAVLELERPAWVVGADVALLTRLASAVQTCKRARLSYRKEGGAVGKREVEPYGLMQHSGRWFLGGYCLLRRALRLFRVDRIETVAVLKGTFERPADFEMAAFLRESIAFAPAPWEVSVWLDAPPETLRRRVGARAVLEPEGDGTRLRCGVTDLDAFAVTLLYLGCGLEVTKPPELGRAFQTLAERVRRIALPNVGSAPE